MSARIFTGCLLTTLATFGISSADWSSISGMSSTAVTALATTQGDTLFAGTYNDGVYRTDDHGTTWWLMLGQSTYNVYGIYSLAVDKSGYVYAGTHTEGLLRSTNNGSSWSWLSGGDLPMGDINAVNVNSAGNLFASYGGSIYRSTDGGNTWTKVRSGSALYSIACYGSDKVYVCGTSDGFYSSTDGGATWTFAGSGLSGKYPYTVAVNSNGKIFVGTTGYGVYVSTDGGSTFTATNNGLTTSNINTVSVGPSGTIYAGTHGGGVFFSTDDGSSWTPGNVGLTNKDIRSIGFDAVGHVYAGAYVGTHSGGLWQASSPLPIQLISFSAYRSATGVILQWKTASETNNYGFEIQQSGSPQTAFSTMPGAFIPGAGTSLQEHSYRFVVASPPPGSWYYRLKQIDRDGALAFSKAVLVTTSGSEQPAEFSLGSNYPNPFNPETNIRYQIAPARHGESGGSGAKSSMVRLSVYDVLGREVAVLVNEPRAPGNYEVRFDGSGLASGVYLYRLKAGGYIESKKMILTK